jgi:outer membrane protein TolC
MTVRAARGQLFPQVGFSASATVADEDFFPSEKDDWSVSVFARLRLFDSGKVHGQVVEARSAAEELLYRLEDLKRQVALEVASSQVNLEGAIQRVKVASDAVAQAEEDYRMALKRYQAQVGTNIDVLDARLALIDAKNSKIDAVAEARTAYGDLLFAMGEGRDEERKETSR